MSVSFCLPYPVAVSAFMICRSLCACTEMLWMCVQYVSFGSKVRPRTFGCVAMGSALLFIVRSRLFVYSAGSGVNRVQVVLSGFSKRVFYFVQAKTLCRYGCMYYLSALVLVCVDVIVMSCCCLPTPMTLASGGSPMFPLVVHQPASPSIWPAVQSLRRGLSTNPGATMWCVCGCS